MWIYKFLYLKNIELISNLGSKDLKNILFYHKNLQVNLEQSTQEQILYESYSVTLQWYSRYQSKTTAIKKKKADVKLQSFRKRCKHFQLCVILH